ncbi:MAG: hypothetical protein QNJ53_20455 [Pleurocapsa sp. MO_192.B19]|nr:hypothetical protein [Pleurocapsa sp. MO_192.B19]
MSNTEIQQASETATVDSTLEEQNTLDSQLKLQQQTEAEKEQTITELEQRLVQEAVSAIEETKQASAAIEKEEEYLPIPILKARGLIENASTQSDRDKAMQLLADARTQLKLSQELGYAKADAEYKELKTELKNLEKQLKAGGNTDNAFEKLQTKIAGFFQRLSQAKK